MQAGFRKGYGVFDHAFTLQWLIQQARKANGKIYAVFLDFSKAFDTVPRADLWRILEEEGLPTDLRRILQMQYANTSVVLLLKDGVSKEVLCNVGVRQGDPGQSRFVCFLYAAIRESTETKTADPLMLKDRPIMTMMYADDVLLPSSTPEGLQQLLQETQEFSQKYMLKVNLDKSAYMIFGGSKEEPQVQWEGATIPVYTDYPQLGIQVAVDGNPLPAISHRSQLPWAVGSN